VTIWGDGSVVRDYLYVSDLVEALEMTAKVETQSKVLNIGSGRGVSLNELVALMAEVTGEEPEVEYLPGRALDVPANVLDITRAQEELGWSPQTELPEGIAITWEWVRTLAEHRLEREA
jgi:UDP-glucose 4-epimerase